MIPIHVCDKEVSNYPKRKNNSRDSAVRTKIPMFGTMRSFSPSSSGNVSDITALTQCLVIRDISVSGPPDKVRILGGDCAIGVTIVAGVANNRDVTDHPGLKSGLTAKRPGEVPRSPHSLAAAEKLQVEESRRKYEELQRNIASLKKRLEAKKVKQQRTSKETEKSRTAKADISSSVPIKTTTRREVGLYIPPFKRRQMEEERRKAARYSCSSAEDRALKSSRKQPPTSRGECVKELDTVGNGGAAVYKVSKRSLPMSRGNAAKNVRKRPRGEQQRRGQKVDLMAPGKRNVLVAT